MSHSRKLPSRAALTRRTTKGPLDADEPLSPPSTSASSTHSRSFANTPRGPSPNPQGQLRSADSTSGGTEPTVPQQSTATTSRPEDVKVDSKDLSFLLDASIYHPLSQLEVPGPFRKAFTPPPSAETPIEESLDRLDSLLSQCDYLRAAQFTGSILTSGTVRPTDENTIFRLLEIRYSCLELSGNVLLAAQEAKALEDLGSAFYYDEPISVDEGVAEEVSPPSRHIMPFSLRLQALRLQSIGFSDPRRGVSALYDIGVECREHIAAATTSEESRKVWSNRLEEIGIRVVNALIEMGDLDCARRTLHNMRPIVDAQSAVWTFRMSLLCLKMGLIGHIGTLVNNAAISETNKLLIRSLLAVSDEHYDDADKLLNSEAAFDENMLALVKQNLAVVFLYKGEVKKARSVLEALIDQQNSFQTLTINLATIYDLTSDRSRDMKVALVNKIAEQGMNKSRSFTNADFKIQTAAERLRYDPQLVS